ncbi:hypothetical protein CFK38_04360 [Brachybacterium vulturis]|uniref:Uncharacterized protein n=1 Tax=Brachybacterium vulturis TaxID=2017484 RepID=A0A291GLA4_9MICO|nr:hypothetical protein [Brachybacterium vulturis]ATG50842.1 hypothetical protein CFK38_04360 [Brachybacterium vulturis]
MTSPHARPLPPLRELPPPQQLPRDSSSLVPPGEIIAESKAAIRRRLLRILWAPGLVLLGLWYLLLMLYVSGASPAFWFFSLLAALGDPSFLDAAIMSLGFTPSGLGTAFLVVPAAATLLSLPMALLAPSLLAGLRPRLFLSERAFQREVATRVTALLMLPPILVVLLLPLTVLLDLTQPWSGLGAGPLSAWCLGLAALQLAWVLVRRLVPASSLLGITEAGALVTTARLERDLDKRAAAAAQVRAQDRRHLPPNLGTPALGGAATPRGALRALGLIARSSLTWVVPAALGIGWAIFAITDLVTVLSGLASMDLTQMTSPLPWQQPAVAAPLCALVLGGLALSPALSVLLAATQRDQVRDQRTYEEWAHRARVNPWEARVVGLTGWFAAGWMLLGAVLAALVLHLLQVATALSWAWIVMIVLVLVPLQGLAAEAAMRAGLRDVLYGPAGDFMLRESPYALVAPDLGTRADRAKDPAVRAALRKRLQAAGGDPDAPQLLEIFDLDTAGERLWVDDSEPGAGDTAVREADLARGTLPDFGGEGSAFTGGGQEPAALEAPQHGIPESLGGLRDRRR